MKRVINGTALSVPKAISRFSQVNHVSVGDGNFYKERLILSLSLGLTNPGGSPGFV